jgi:hypothetical protein
MITAGTSDPANVTKPFLHQADAWAAGRSHDAHTRGRRTIHHVDGRHFTLRLQENTI